MDMLGPGGLLGWIILCTIFMVVATAVMWVWRKIVPEKPRKPALGPHRDTEAQPSVRKREVEYLEEEAAERERVIARIDADHAENWYPMTDAPPLDLESLEGVINSAVAAHMREFKSNG